jgi:anti-sigma factor RsiW
MNDRHTDHPDDDLLIALALDELDAGERTRVEAHLGACASCRGVVATLAGSIDSLRAAPRPTAPAGILVELLEAQSTARVERRWSWWGRLWQRRLVPVPALVVFLVLLGAAFWAGRRSAPSTVPTAFEPGPGRGRGAIVRRAELPEPPRIPFQVAAALDST